jgi:hypothetical protein
LVTIALAIVGVVAWWSARSGRQAAQPARTESGEASTFVGSVRETSSRAISGALIKALWIAGDAAPRELSRTRTRSDGFYELGVRLPLERGVLSMVAEADGFGASGRHVEPRASRQDFVLLRGSTSVTVQVVTENGHAVGGAEVIVSLEPFAAEPDALLLFTGESDDKGRFRADKVPVSAGKLHWSAVTRGSGRAVGMKEKPASDQPITVIAELDAGTKISGVAVDGHGKPVTGVPVRIAETSGPWVERALSATEGRFEMTGAPRGAELLLGVEGDWVLANGQDTFPLRTADKVDAPAVRLIVEPAGTIDGSVIARGPIAGAVISAMPTDRSLGAPREVVSDRDGNFQLRGLRSNTTWELTARHPDYAPAFADRLSVRTRGLLLRMSTGGRLAGRVLDGTGRPYGDVQVYAHRISRSEQKQAGVPTVVGLREYADVQSDREGRFVVDHLNAGEYRVEYRQATRMAFSPTAALTRTAALREGETTTLDDARLERSGKLRIVARARAGAVSDQLAVSILPNASGGAPHRARLSRGAAGTFEMQALEPGVYDISVHDRKLGYASASAIRIESGASAEATVEFTGTLSLRGKIVDDGKAPVATAVVDAFLAGSGSQAGYTLAGRAPDNFSGNTALSREDGSFELTGLSPGSHRVHVRKPGLPPVELTIAVEQTMQPLAIRLPRGAELEVALATAAAQKVIVAEAAGGAQHFQSAVTDTSGIARFEALPAGSYRLSAIVPDLNPARVSLAAGESKRVVLTVSRGNETQNGRP